MYLGKTAITAPLRDVKFYSQIQWCLCLYILLMGIFVGIFVAALSLPDKTIEDNLSNSVADGALTRAPEAKPSPFGHRSHKFDMFSECVGLSENLGNTERSMLYRMAATPYISSSKSGIAGKGDSHPCADLVDALKAKPDAALPYFRFWHGYQAYDRFLLSFTDVYGLHVANGIVLYMSLIYLCIKMSDWYGLLAPALFVLPYAIWSDLLTAPLVTVHALPLAWTYVSIAFAMSLLDADRTPTLRLFLFCFASGSIFNYISMLFTPQLAAAFIAFVVITHALRSKDPIVTNVDAIWNAAFLAVSWFFGFGVTWISKWLLAVAVLGYDNVRSSLLNAASGVNYHAVAILAEYRTVPATLLISTDWLVVCVAVSLGIAGACITMKAAQGANLKRMLVEWLLLQTPLLIIIGWTELMRAHSVEHAVFAQRGLILFILFPLLGALFEMRKAEPPSRDLRTQP